MIKRMKSLRQARTWKFQLVKWAQKMEVDEQFQKLSAVEHCLAASYL